MLAPGKNSNLTPYTRHCLVLDEFRDICIAKRVCGPHDSSIMSKWTLFITKAIRATRWLAKLGLFLERARD